MAVTHWPDFSTANLTDWAPVQTLLDAIRERVVVLRCVHLPSRNGNNTVSVAVVPSAMRRDVPKAAVLDGIRTAICSLARFFVEPDNEAWHNGGCKNDLVCFGQDAPIRVGAEHSLAVLPDTASCEADPQALSAYRTFLANAAWWLDAFRYVDASERAAFATKLYMWENDLIEDWSDISDQLDNPTATTPEDGYPLRTVNRNGYPSTLLSACEESLSYQVEKNDTYPPYYTSGHTPHADDWQAGTRKELFAGQATCYEGLSVANPSPLSADVFLLPLTKEANRYVDRRMTGPVEFVGIEHLDYEMGHYWLESYEASTRSEDWFGRGLKPYEETRSEVEWTGEDEVQTHYVNTNTVYHNSPDGTVVESETSTGSGEGDILNRCRYPVAFYEEILHAFDAFGIEGAALGVLLATGIVAAARSTAEIGTWNPDGKIPLAEGWADRPTDKEELHAPSPQRRSLDFILTAHLGLAVVFDFGPYFQFGGYDAEH